MEKAPINQPMTPTHFDAAPKRNDGDKKKITALTVALVIFVVATLGLGGYVVYSLLNQKTEVAQNNQPTVNLTEETTIEENEDAELPELANRVKVVNFYPNSVAVLDGELAYVSINGSTQQIDNVFGQGMYQTLVNTQQGYQEFSFDNLEYSNGNVPFTGMKMNISGVTDIYVYESGQQINPEYGLMFRYIDNDLSYISLKKLIEGTDIPFAVYLEDVEDVVTENDGGMTTYAILANGEKVNLADYIPDY